MTQPMEHDWPPTMRARRGRRRRPLPLEGEVLGPEEPEPETRIHRVEIAVHHHRQRQHVPPWAIAILIIGFLCWVSPLGLVIAIAMISMGVMMHPEIGIAIAIFIVLICIIAWRERRRGRAF